MRRERLTSCGKRISHGGGKSMRAREVANQQEHCSISAFILGYSGLRVDIWQD